MERLVESLESLTAQSFPWILIDPYRSDLRSPLKIRIRRGNDYYRVAYFARSSFFSSERLTTRYLHDLSTCLDPQLRKAKKAWYGSGLIS